jgi:hypothetical protein
VVPEGLVTVPVVLLLLAVGAALRLVRLAAREAVAAMMLVAVMTAALVAVVGLIAAAMALVRLRGDGGCGRQCEGEDEGRQKLLHDGAP